MNITSRPYLYPRIKREAFMPALLPFKTNADLKREFMRLPALCVKRERNARSVANIRQYLTLTARKVELAA